MPAQGSTRCFEGPRGRSGGHRGAVLDGLLENTRFFLVSPTFWQEIWSVFDNFVSNNRLVATAHRERALRSGDLEYANSERKPSGSQEQRLSNQILLCCQHQIDGKKHLEAPPLGATGTGASPDPPELTGATTPWPIGVGRFR